MRLLAFAGLLSAAVAGVVGNFSNASDSRMNNSSSGSYGSSQGHSASIPSQAGTGIRSSRAVRRHKRISPKVGTSAEEAETPASISNVSQSFINVSSQEVRNASEHSGKTEAQDMRTITDKELEMERQIEGLKNSVDSMESTGAKKNNIMNKNKVLATQAQDMKTPERNL